MGELIQLFRPFYDAGSCDLYVEPICAGWITPFDPLDSPDPRWWLRRLSMECVCWAAEGETARDLDRLSLHRYLGDVDVEFRLVDLLLHDFIRTRGFSYCRFDAACDPIDGTELAEADPFDRCSDLTLFDLPLRPLCGLRCEDAA